MDERKATERGGWLDPGGPQHISDDEVEAGLALFLNAAKRAQDTLASRSAPAAGGRRRWARRLLAAGSVVLLLCLTAAVALLGPLVNPVEATPFAGLQGTVNSLQESRAVPGVMVYRLVHGNEQLRTQALLGASPAYAAVAGGKAAAHADRIPVASTNSLGMFTIRPSELCESAEYALEFDGREVDRFTIKEKEIKSGDVGTRRISAELKRSKRQQVVTLAPGSNSEARPGLKLALDAAAKQDWTGLIMDEKQWPSNFIFGQVAAGIVTVEGPAEPALHLSVFISDDVLQLFGARPADLRLISYSSEYNQESNDWRQHAHRGWYVATNPPGTYLPKKELTLDTVMAAGGKPGGVWVSWRPETGAPYALLVAPNLTGEAMVVWYDSVDGNGMRTIKPGVRLINRNRLQALLYDVDYYDPITKQTYTFEQFPYRPQRESWFFDGSGEDHGMEPRGMLDTEFWIPIVKPLEEGNIAGVFTLRLMDFTVDNQKEWTGITYRNHTRPGSYNIEFGAARLGKPVTVRLTGDLDRLACAPDWDFDSDNVIDKFSTLETKCTPFHTGSFSITAVVREKDGKVILVDRRLPLPITGALGYERYDMTDVLVCSGLKRPKRKLSSLYVLSPCAVASPSAFGYIASQKLGPSLYIELPENMCNTPLKESRTYIFVRAVGGENEERDETAYLRDSRRMYLEPTNSWGKLQRGYYLSLDNDGLELPWANDDDDDIELLSGDCGHSWYIYLALGALDSNDHTEVLAWLKDKNDTPLARDRFKAYTGIDLNQPPATDEFVAQLRDYEASPYFNVKFATPECTEMQWNVKLFGLSVEPGNGMIAEIHINDYNLLMAGQWEVYSGGDCPSRVEIEAENGEKVVRYFDYSPLAAPAPVRLAAGGG